jgi:hypothetical protein
MSGNKRKPPSGQVRQSQLITSFGPGAMMDLPKHSVLVGGLDSWAMTGQEIAEPRLIEKLKTLFDPPLSQLRLMTPPPDPNDATVPLTGITAWQFPEWFITQDAESEPANPLVRARRLVHRKSLTGSKFIDDRRVRRTVVPVRFVRACRNGHINDVEWYSFVHSTHSECRRPLWMIERGTTGDIAEIYIRCECGASRGLAEAVGFRTEALGKCDGRKLWLGPYERDNCNESTRLLVRQASNAYFPQLMSVISLPDRNEDLRDAVEAVWDFIGEVEDLAMLQYERKKAKVRPALQDYSDEEVLAEIRVRRGESAQSNRKIKHVEMETLIGSKEELGDDKPDGTFFARTLSKSVWDQRWMSGVQRVVLVHRLREVMAQVGFTRFEAVSPDIDGELEMGVRRAPLAREISWLPAVENRGEGVFIQFQTEAVRQWASRPEVKERGRELLAGYDAWKAEHPGRSLAFVEAGGLLPYVLFHSFSHLMITAVSLECGYPASSIRERIYSIPDIGYGVLLYTGSADAEGTLGGLIQVGRRIHQHIRNALDMGELCSNDPVCAQHDPPNVHERRFLHGAACHGCLLISETSCEQHNEFLDRALVVPTVDNLGVEFFPRTGG